MSSQKIGRCYTELHERREAMSIKPRTIDSLGVEASVRYAKDKSLFESRWLEESNLIPKKIEIPLFKPYVPSEFDQLFLPTKTAVWAIFTPPPNYFISGKPLFTYQLIPSFGGYEKQETDLDKLTSLEDALSKKKKRQRRNSSDQEKEKDEKERQVLLAFLACMQKLDKTLTLINSRRNQYQRG